MKKFVSLLMALLFLLGISVSAFAEDLPKFSGLVTDVSEGTLTVCNANGNTLTFTLSDPAIEIPEIGALIELSYSGDLITVAEVADITVITPANLKPVSGTVAIVDASSISVKPAKGKAVTVAILPSTTVSGKAETYKEGDTVTVTYAEYTQFMATVNLCISVEVTKIKQEKKEEDNTNKKMTGVVTYVDHSEIEVRTSKGKVWSFKLNSKTKYPSKKQLLEGCTVTITYDGHAAKHPYAKIVKVTKTKEETERGKTYKKSGTVANFGGMVINLTNGFWADVAYAKHSGKGDRVPGRKVTVYYYKQNGENYATKIKWK